MRASPSLSQLWQPHSRLCQLCRVCEQQRSCSPGFCRKELHATEGAVEVRRARRRLEEAATDERVGLFTPDKKRGTADGAGRAANLAARRGTVCGEVGRVLHRGTRPQKVCRPQFQRTQRASGLRPSRRSLPRGLHGPDRELDRYATRSRLGLRWRLPQERLAHDSVSPVAG